MGETIGGLGGVREGAASEGEPGRVCFLPSMTPYPPTAGLRRVLLSSLTILALLEVFYSVSSIGAGGSYIQGAADKPVSFAGATFERRELPLCRH
jgi:hypothetical protein